MSKTDTSQDLREDIEDDEIIGKALRRSLLVFVGVLVSAGAVWFLLSLFAAQEKETHQTQVALPTPRDVTSIEPPHVPLRDVTQHAGIDWTHISGMEGEKLLPETMGGGVAIFDYDQDGDQDILLVGGCSWPWSKSPVANPRSLCLYQNDGQAHFSDVTQQAGLNQSFYAMAPVIGDFDNDGWPDLFVTAVGSNRLFKNNAGKFIDISATSGLRGEHSAWNSGATWFDYDNDGRLDLFVCEYVVWQRELDFSLGFSLTGIGRAYGQPTAFRGTQSHLYHNEGDGVFTDVSKPMGIEVVNADTGVAVGKGLAVAAIDVDHDGWTDLMVANDTVRNFVFLNMLGQRFEEQGIPLGVAFDRSGNATGAMGIDCSYLRNDDCLAIAIGNFANEQSSLYIARGPEPPFNDQAMATGLGPASRLSLTFGMFFADLDLDSRQDLVCSNGHLEAEIATVQATQQYAQPPQFFWNAGTSGSTELVPLDSASVGEEALERMVGRGAAYGDLDGDGDLDIVLVANSGHPRVLINQQQLGHHWLRLRLQGSGTSNRDAYGAVVTLTCGDQQQRRIVSATRSYLSQCETTLTFGLGDQESIDAVTIRWPNGRTQTLTDIPVDQTHTVVQP
ncbi:MAG: CRTAC1 family protein [Planctomycetales bacterium]|nr:CRTAC1 family protein [Planctomycetales bacterium]